MTDSIVNTIVNQLQSERARLESELRRVSAALSAFGKAYMNGRRGKAAPVRRARTISAAGRRRIAAAQRARWAKVRAAKKAKAAKA
jgi:cob(I)alamin adenosyltransferase